MTTNTDTTATVWERQQSYIELVGGMLDEKELRTGRKPSVFIRTFGCQQNVADGERLAGMFLEMGYSIAQDMLKADFIIFNTCAVRENAEDRIFGNVGALKHAKEANPELVIGLCGCMMQQAHVVEKIRRSYPYVDLVFGTHAMPRLPQLVFEMLSEKRRVMDISGQDGEIVEHIPVRRDGTIKAFLPVMLGCDNFCTYCVVPLVRGRERSREPEAVLDEARKLIADGYKEITLLGQNVNSYGKGLSDGVNFAELLRRIAAIPGEFRIRFMTSHPRDCTHELIDTIAENPKICRHIHLPVQSGSDRILKLMNRHYDVARYTELIDYAKEKIPGVAFTSDIIVGFPGETQEDFDATLHLVERVEYLSLFTFLYSPRKGTKAADMPDDTTAEEKSRRFQKLLGIQQKIGNNMHQAMVGTTVRVLVEGEAKTAGQLSGRAESGAIVNIINPETAERDLVGSFVDVKITEAHNWAVDGIV